LQDKQLQTWLIIGGLITILTYSYWNTLGTVAAAWETSQYSHGYLVPLISVLLLWVLRKPFEGVPISHRWWGAGLLALGVLLRLIGAYTVTFTVDNVSFIPCLLGIFVMVGGLQTLRWAGLPIAFLVFMYPLPRVLVDNILRPLQTVATQSSLVALHTLGVAAYREGNRIVLDKMQMGVVDACSGLRMLTIFLALAAAIAMITTTRPWWERVTIFATAIPIALAVNIIRITVTGLLYNLQVKDEVAQMVFHDAAGWIMMPIALGFLFLGCQILSRLVIEVEPSEVRSVQFAAPGRTQNAPKRK